MFLPVLILHADPALLRLACIITFAFGLTAFLFGLRHPRALPKTSPAPLEPVSSNPVTSSLRLRASSQPEILTQQVIRLSLPSLPARSTDMTQQEKVAAALVRAGIANPGWTLSPAVPSDDKSVSTSTAVAEPPPLPAKDISPIPQSEKHASVNWGRKLLLLGGPLLALISLCLFSRIR